MIDRKQSISIAIVTVYNTLKKTYNLQHGLNNFPARCFSERDCSGHRRTLPAHPTTFNTKIALLPLLRQNLWELFCLDYKYWARLSPLKDSISLRISCARDLTGSSTSSSSSARKGMVSGKKTRYSSFSFSTRYLTILRPKIRDLNRSFRVCINTCNTDLSQKKQSTKYKNTIQPTFYKLLKFSNFLYILKNNSQKIKSRFIQTISKPKCFWII